MREIGGYIELDLYRLPMLHESGIALNCARNCLAYLIETKRIERIALPFFLCNSIEKTCRKYGVEISYYVIDEMLRPESDFVETDMWIYLVNYYGQLTRTEIESFCKKHTNVILDFSQSYFEPPIKGTDTIYSCRKFFGVPDGGILFTDSISPNNYEIDISHERMSFILGRFEEPANCFYAQYVSNNHSFENEPIKKMSKLTRNLLHGIDYEYVRERREENYKYLFHSFSKNNMLKLREDISGAFSYPLLIYGGAAARKRLISKGIFIPQLWPDVLENQHHIPMEKFYAENILPLPCDQRYSLEDMEYIAKAVKLEI